MLQKTVTDHKAMEAQHRDDIKRQMETLHTHLHQRETKDAVTGQIHDKHSQKIDELKSDMTKAMSEEIKHMREQSLKDFKSITELMEQQKKDGRMQKLIEEQEVILNSIQAELQETTQAQRARESEASNLKVRLASTEERARMLQARQEEGRKERSNFDEERRGLRLQAEEQLQQNSVAEAEVHQLKAEAELQKEEIARIGATQTKDAETLRQEREVWRDREAALQRNISELRDGLDLAKKQDEYQSLKATHEQDEVAAPLRLKIEDLEAQLTSNTEKLKDAQRERHRLESEREAAQASEEALREMGVVELKQYQEDLEEARVREQELMHMLNEVQNSIMQVPTQHEAVEHGMEAMHKVEHEFFDHMLHRPHSSHLQ